MIQDLMIIEYPPAINLVLKYKSGLQRTFAFMQNEDGYYTNPSIVKELNNLIKNES